MSDISEDQVQQAPVGDYQSAGLSDLGRPEGFLERQVGRWKSQLDSYQKREIPGIEAVAQWLDENTPKNSAIGIMHGDYNFHNMLFSRGKNTRLLAVLDWENATIDVLSSTFVFFFTAVKRSILTGFSTHFF